MSSMNAITKLNEERKDWRKSHPEGFYARPLNGNMMLWEFGIPGRADTPWWGGLYKGTMQFSDNYPSRRPEVKFTPPYTHGTTFYHMNVYSSGIACFDLDGPPTIKSILTVLQHILNNPNPSSPAQPAIKNEYNENRNEYTKKVKEQAKQNWASPL